MKITKRQLKRIIREAEGTTEKYDDDSALKGKQSNLPDGLQKSIIDKTVEDREEDEEDEEEEKNESVQITRRQLRRIIKESIDVMNASTGEVMLFADEVDKNGFKPDAPEAAAREIVKRLKLTPLEGYSDGLQEPGTEEIWLGAEDYAVMDVELSGKRHARKSKKELARMDIDNLLTRTEQWASDASGDYSADNPDADMELVARDLAASAEYSFRQDEWEELIYHFNEDDRGEEDLINFIADRIAG